MSRIRKLITGVHMGLGHDGIAKLLAAPVSKGGVGIDVNTLSDGDLIMLINRHGDKLKVIGCGGLVVGYLKMRKHQKIMKEALQFIPATFGGSGFNYDAACKEALKARGIV